MAGVENYLCIHIPTIISPQVRTLAHSASLFATLIITLAVPGLAHGAPDAGAPNQAADAGRAARDAARPAGLVDAGLRPTAAGSSSPTSAPATASSAPTKPHVLRVAALEAQIAGLLQATAAIAKLGTEALSPPAGLAALLPGRHDDPLIVAERIRALSPLIGRLDVVIQAAAREAKAIEPLLRTPVDQLARREAERQRALAARAAADRAASKLGARQRRRVKLPPLPAPIPPALALRAEVAQRRLTLGRLEQRKRGAQLALRKAELAWLTRSQPTRKAAYDRARSEAEARQATEKRALEDAQKSALAEQAAADVAQKKALEAQQRAATRAERLLSAERARLEGVRGEQARLRSALVTLRRQLRKQREAWRDERADFGTKLAALVSAEQANPASFDALYDRVVTRLAPLRPAARQQLWNAIQGGPETPEPAALSAELASLPEGRAADVRALAALRRKLDQAADTLDDQQQKLLHDRLVAIHDEVDGLNRQRLALLPRLSEAKRRALVSISQPMIEQLLREVTQLVYDVLYWSYTRLRQVHEVPRLIYDVFTVGSALYRALKLVLVIWLFILLLRRLEPLLARAVHGVGHSLTLGRFAVPLAKLVDTLRHASRAIVVLVFSALLYRMLGGEGGPAEVRVTYELLFWIAIYRLQLRLVESLAKYTGMEAALRGAEGEELLEDDDPDLEGPPCPHAIRLLQASAARGIEASKIVPASVLLVRSVRAATRYLLTIVLLLQLTELAVGKGTIYGLTIDLYYWAAVPFVIYFLVLWRPHIARAYLSQLRRRDSASGDEDQSKKRGRTDGPRAGALGRAVTNAQNRWYGVFVIAVAFVIVLGDQLGRFARRYLTSLDATKKLLAFAFRRQVEKHAQQRGHVVQKRQLLPEGLVKQFPLGPLEPNQRLLEQPFWPEIHAVYDNWKAEGRDGSLVLVGRAGMGKTTTLRALESELGVSVLRGEPKTKLTRPAKVVHWLSDVFGFSPRANSEKELIERIRDDKHPVVAIDSCENLFLRYVGGFDGWEAFIRVVTATSDNVLWVLAINHAAWDYLHNTSGRVHYFRRVLELPSWSEDEIRRLLMTRMRRARFRVSFSDLVVTELEGTSLSAQIGRTAQGYFRLLWDSTGGNPRLASHLWLDSLVPDGEREMRVHLFASPPIVELERLPDDIIFVLTTITAHENLSAEEVARTTNLPLDFCTFACHFCRERGFLELDGQTQRLRLGLRWQREILRFLRRRQLVRS
jgi:hypothetical protein